MKRQRENETLDLANCLILLSQFQQTKSHPQTSANPPEFECKTCNRKFSSFQALGGHRASHKKPKLDGEEDLKTQARSLSLKPKMHECSICGLGFSLGQALGGHMRKHRAAFNDGLSSINQVVAKVPVLKRSNSTRVSCMDLNLTPLENDLKLLFGNYMPPKIDALV